MSRLDEPMPPSTRYGPIVLGERDDGGPWLLPDADGVVLGQEGRGKTWTLRRIHEQCRRMDPDAHVLVFTGRGGRWPCPSRNDEAYGDDHVGAFVRRLAACVLSGAPTIVIVDDEHFLRTDPEGPATVRAAADSPAIRMFRASESRDVPDGFDTHRGWTLITGAPDAAKAPRSHRLWLDHAARFRVFPPLGSGVLLRTPDAAAEAGTVAPPSLPRPSYSGF